MIAGQVLFRITEHKYEPYNNKITGFERNQTKQEKLSQRRYLKCKGDKMSR